MSVPESKSPLPDPIPVGIPQAPPPHASPQQGVTWGRAGRILTFGLGALAIVWFVPHLWGIEDVLKLVIALVTTVCLILWFFRRSGFSRPIKQAGAGLLVLAVVVLVASFKIDGFYGNNIPILVWRGTPTPEQKLAEYRKASQELDSRPAPVEDADLAPARVPVVVRDFPGFLGADRRGAVAGLKLQRDWKTFPPKELWRHPIGRGWSSFAIVGTAAVTQEQRENDEAVLCYDLFTGQQRWEIAVPTRFSEALGGDGPRATPTIDQGQVFALGANGDLLALDLETGSKLWSVNILTDNSANNITWGMSASPLVTGNLVIVSPGGRNNNSLVAYDRHTGQRVWQAGSARAAYSSPQLTTIDGQPQVLILNGEALAGHDPVTGAQLWSFPWMAGPQRISVSQPLYLPDFGMKDHPGEILIACAYGAGAGLLKVERNQDEWKVSSLWQSQGLQSKFSNIVIHEGYVYGFDGPILACLDLKDGRRCWKSGRYGFGQMLLVDDLLLLQDENGPVVLIEATPEAHREIAKLRALSERTWNTPALAGRYLLVRNDREAVCYELPLVSD